MELPCVGGLTGHDAVSQSSVLWFPAALLPSQGPYPLRQRILLRGGLSDLSLHHTVHPSPMPREFLQIKTKPLINLCFSFASFPPGWELKSKHRNAARLDENTICLGPRGPRCLTSRSPSHQEVTGRRVRAVCAAAKWGSEATLGLSRRVLHPLLLALGRSQPAPGCRTVGSPVVGTAALMSSSRSWKLCQRWWELGVRWGQPRSPGGHRDGVSVGQAWEWAGWEMSLATCRPQNGSEKFITVALYFWLTSSFDQILPSPTSYCLS